MKFLLSLFTITLLVLFQACSHVDKTLNKPVSPGDSIPLNNINVVLIVGDDIGYEIPTCNGGQSYLTPHLDSLAQNGMRFTQCYASPLCSPSRISLLTGKYNFRNYFTWGVLNTNQLTIGNLFQDNNYRTYYAGKWQLDGGGSSIKKFGFDDYVVWQAYNLSWAQCGSRYKSPHIYANGDYLPLSDVKGKYGDDIFVDSVKSFISKNRQQQFFVYYAMPLAHLPFCPTPDNPDYASWPGGDVNKSNTKYFPDMIKYMDKKIGELINFLHQENLDKNTIVLFVGDNGTPTEITSLYNGKNIKGGKGNTYTYGTHVPLIAYWPGKIAPGIVNDNLISLPDFLPTLANITHISIPSSFNPLDGISFANQLNGDNSLARNFIYNFYRYDTSFTPTRWVQNTQYKLYDSSINAYHKPGFYNLQNDIMEETPLPYSNFSTKQQLLYHDFQHVMDSIK